MQTRGRGLTIATILGPGSCGNITFWLGGGFGWDVIKAVGAGISI